MTKRSNFPELARKITTGLLVVMWILFPIGQFLRYDLVNEINVNLFDLLAGITSVPILLTVVFGRPRRGNRLFIAWVLLALVWVVPLFLSPLSLDPRSFLVSCLYIVRWLAGSSLIFLGWVLIGGDRLLVAKLMLIGGAGTVVSGLVQYVLFPYLGPLTNQGWDPHLFRVVGSFLDPGFTGFIFDSLLILLMVMKTKLRLGGWWFGLTAACWVGLLLTYSRASYLGFLAGLGVVAVRRRAYGWYLKVAAVFFLMIVLLPRPAGEGIRLERENSIKARLENWSHALLVFRDHPVLGVGFNAYRYAQEQYGYLNEGTENHAASGSDSSLLLVLATSGVVGFSTFGFFVFKLIGGVLSDKGVFKELALSTMAVLLFHFWFLNSLFYPWVLAWVATVVGISGGEWLTRKGT